MTNNTRQRLGAIAALGVTVLASGCSGGGASNAPAVPAAVKNSGHAATTKAKLTIKIPIRKAASTKSSLRKPAYLSSYTADLGIRAGTADTIATAPWQLFDITNNSSLCTPPTGGYRTCVVTITAPAVDGDNDIFEIDATDQAPLPTDIIPLGNLLSSGYATQVVSAGVVNPINVALSGVIGTLAMAGSVAAPTYSVWAPPGQSGLIPFGIIANDLHGGQIAGQPANFENPITFTDHLPVPPSTYAPYTYPTSMPPPSTPGPILGSVSYLAPMTGTSQQQTTVSVGTAPFFWKISPPTATFYIDPLVVSVAGEPVGQIPGLVAGALAIPVTVNEFGAASFSVSISNDDGSFTLNGLTNGSILADETGTATFSVTPVIANNPAKPPSVLVTDANGTTATLPAVVTAALAAQPSALITKAKVRR